MQVNNIQYLLPIHNVTVEYETRHACQWSRDPL